MTPPWTPLTCIPPLCNLAPPLLTLLSRPTLVSKLLIPHLPILYVLPLPSTTVPCSWLSFCASCFHSPLTLSGFFNGKLEVFEPRALNYSTFFRPILSTSSAFRNPILTPLPLSGFSALRSDCTHFRSGIFSSDTTHTSDGIVIFVRQGLSFSELSTSSLSSLHPYSDYVGINISLNYPSSLSFLNAYAPYLLLSNGWQNRFLLSPIFPSSRNLFILGGFNCHHPLWDSRVTSNPCGEDIFDWVISSNLLPLNDPDTPTLLHRSSGSRSSPGISFAPSSLALSCSWEVLQYLGSDHLPILLSVLLSLVFHPNERLSSLTLMSFSRRILISFLCCCSFYLSDFECGQILHSFWPHQTPS